MRKTRIQLVGKIERREAEERTREFQKLAAELHQQWRERDELVPVELSPVEPVAGVRDVDAGDA